MVDTLRETRAMILLSLPFPPLPMTVDKVEADSLLCEDQTVTTSHTLISRCLQDAAERGDMEANKRRKKAQIEVFQRFLHALAVSGFDAEPPELYNLYCDYTRLHILTFFEGLARIPHIEFKSYDYVCKGDPTHSKMCEYMAAQSVLFGDQPIKPREFYATKSFACLLEITRDRFGHTMTEEERQFLDESATLEEPPQS